MWMSGQMGKGTGPAFRLIIHNIDFFFSPQWCDFFFLSCYFVTFTSKSVDSHWHLKPSHVFKCTHTLCTIRLWWVVFICFLWPACHTQHCSIPWQQFMGFIRFLWMYALSIGEKTLTMPEKRFTERSKSTYAHTHVHAHISLPSVLPYWELSRPADESNWSMILSGFYSVTISRAFTAWEQIKGTGLFQTCILTASSGMQTPHSAETHVSFLMWNTLFTVDWTL